MIARGDLFWADLGEPVGSRPAKRRPVVVVQSAPYNDSRLATVVVAVMTSNTALAAWPGNVFVPAMASGLAKDSVVNVTALLTLDRSELEGPVGRVPGGLMRDVDRGLRSVLGV